MNQFSVKVRYLEGADLKISLPKYQTSGSAGMDLRANFNLDKRISGVKLLSGERALIPTGLAIAITSGFEAQIRPRSGLGWP